MLLPLLIAAGVGYVLGALPFGYLVARAHGVNIFEVGSRNPGATNVKRVLGSRAGNLVFALDALKGAVAAAGALGARFGWEWTPAAGAATVSGSAWLSVGTIWSTVATVRSGYITLSLRSRSISNACGLVTS